MTTGLSRTELIGKLSCRTGNW